jgi:RNA polymerase sigma factor (sigma-70 family)
MSTMNNIRNRCPKHKNKSDLDGSAPNSFDDSDETFGFDPVADAPEIADPTDVPVVDAIDRAKDLPPEEEIELESVEDVEDDLEIGKRRPTTWKPVVTPRPKQAYLEPGQDRDIIARYQKSGDRADLVPLVEAFEGYLEKQAKRYHAPGLTLDDKMQIATDALFEAVDRFDLGWNNGLRAYLGFWLKKRLHDAALTASSVAPPSKTWRADERYQEIQAIKKRRATSPDEWRPEGNQQSGWRWSSAAGPNDLSFDVSVYDEDGDEDGSWIDHYADDGCDDGDQDENRSRLRIALDRINITDRDRQIFELRHLTDKPATFVQLGKRFGITAEGARLRYVHVRTIVQKELDRPVKSCDVGCVYSGRGNALSRSAIRERHEPDREKGIHPLAAGANRALQSDWELLAPTKGEKRHYVPTGNKDLWRTINLTAEEARVAEGGELRENRPAHHIAKRGLAVSSTPRLALIHARTPSHDRKPDRPVRERAWQIRGCGQSRVRSISREDYEQSKVLPYRPRATSKRRQSKPLPLQQVGAVA